MLTARKKNLTAVVIISNGPGELATWVKPLISHLKENITSYSNEKNTNFKFVLNLVPCPNATGNEFKVAKNWGLFDLITDPKDFWKLLIRPSSFTQWPKNGVVVFLGGDQLWSILLAKRLGYFNITYAEWTSRWPRWNDQIAAMNKQVKDKIPKKFRKKCTIVGDLMADIKNLKPSLEDIKKNTWIAILPGSKKAKLSIGIPYFLEVADLITENNQNINLMIPKAPTVELKDFLYYQSDKNPIAKYYSSKIKSIVKIDHSTFDYILETKKNSKLYILSRDYNLPLLSECKLAITTVGANTAELAAINLPMIVVLPTQHLNVMNSWDGIFGILGKIPFMNAIQSFLIEKWYLRKKKFFAWPNIKTKKLIVPERIGKYMPQQIAQEALYLINNANLLSEQKRNLLESRGRDGAIKKLSQLIINSINKN
tara:strand:+ start:2286 stop:3563 length:1278 start_codon:yes stop_codon:yes gene_type:complete